MATLKNPGVLAFDAIIERKDLRGSSAYLPIPLDVAELFGTRGRVPVSATFDAEPYRGSIESRTGHGHRLLVPLDLQERIGKHTGDTVTVTIELDTAERVVELSPDVEAALTAAGLLGTYRDFSYSHQREFADWIESAKREETRATRIAKTVTMITAGDRLN